MTPESTAPRIGFGVGGFPAAFTRRPEARDRGAVFNWLRAIGLDAIELQMTYGPRMPPATCRDYRRRAAELGIRLSTHASYYIVLASPDAAKVARSAETLTRTYELTDLLGAEEIVLHPGSLYGLAEDAAARRFVDNAGAVLNRIGRTGATLMIETAGKVGQMDSVDMILNAAAAVDGIGPCIDFGHVEARTLGGLGTERAVMALFDRLALFQGRNPTKRVHFHYTPIHFGPRGEIQHRALGDANAAGHPFFPRPESVAQGLAGLTGSFTVISETLDSQEQGAMRLRDLTDVALRR